ncbi:diguanylate cyclase [Novosphingobium sp. KCTC 2891]|uniref:diguanylate cyclase n=1 Tax=Novosphingobium sp. KCTC 2891 TaxID=2989730 RepID=UPI0022239EC2|nr:diguanylate cyclase [Novosphingobium sp. KCTC 2891]MCW1384843.1 diguanylate cyclase [Novosphingobium sp. KCTC 2891]
MRCASPSVTSTTSSGSTTPTAIRPATACSRWTLDRISNSRCHVARHGGEEFAVLFRGQTLAQAWAKLDIARAEIAERRLINRATDMPFGRITFSGGLADVFAYPGKSAAMKAADEALYAAKDAGRNQIIMAGSPSPTPARKAA